MQKKTKRDYVYSAIGIAAFVIGGIITRATALENAEKVEDFFRKKENPTSDPQEIEQS